MPGSPVTTLTAGISADATSMTLDDASVLPAAPNICVLGSDSDAEVVSYTNITGNVVSGLVRGLGGTTASAWQSNTAVARNITSYDHDTFLGNINDLDTRKANIADEILYFTSQTVSTGTNSVIIRIPSSGYDSKISSNTVVLECFLNNPSAVTGNLSWTSYDDGHISISGTCTSATTANVTLGTKGN